MIELKEIALSFSKKTVLKNLDLEIEKGSLTTFLGPSGCGKSTLLRIIAGLLPISSGEINFEENRPPETSMVFQDAQLLPWRNVKKNIELSLELRPTASESVESLLEKVGLEDVANYYPSQLSGGMKMRVSLARALVGRPELLLMDEPFGALDEITRAMMGEEVLKFRSWSSSTVVMVTHSIEEALFLSDRVLVMPLKAGAWVLDHEVEVEGDRDRAWRRSSSFRDQLEKLNFAIYEAMGEHTF